MLVWVYSFRGDEELQKTESVAKKNAKRCGSQAAKLSSVVIILSLQTVPQQHAIHCCAEQEANIGQLHLLGPFSKSVLICLQSSKEASAEGYSWLSVYKDVSTKGRLRTNTKAIALVIRAQKNQWHLQQGSINALTRTHTRTLQEPQELKRNHCWCWE